MGLFDFFKKKSIDEYSNATVQKEVIDKSVLDALPSGCIMIVDDVFCITGRGIIVTGTLLMDSVRLNDNLMIMESNKVVQVKAIEMFRKQLDYAQAGDNVGLLLSDISRDEIEAGYKLIKM